MSAQNSDHSNSRRPTNSPGTWTEPSNRFYNPASQVGDKVARILSISYDEPLLFTRELLLRETGHHVHSALGFVPAMAACAVPEYDVLVLGHSIPKEDKLKIIDAFRGANPKAIVVALIRGGEERLKQVDNYVYPGNPEDLLRTIDSILRIGMNDAVRRHNRN